MPNSDGWRGENEHQTSVAVGEREKWSGERRDGGNEAGANAAAEPQTEARRSCGTSRMLARDERAVCRWLIPTRSFSL
jgi:hypothetical protein